MQNFLQASPHDSIVLLPRRCKPAGWQVCGDFLMAQAQWNIEQ
jgi:hypothetical protein